MLTTRMNELSVISSPCMRLSVQCCHLQTKGLSKTLTAFALLLLILCGGGIQLSAATAAQQQSPPPRVNSVSSSNSRSSSESISNSASNFDSSNNNYNNVDSEPLIPPPHRQQQQQQHQQPPPTPPHSPPKQAPSFSSSSLSSLPVRAVSTRPSSDISTTSSDDVPSHYGNCRRYEVCPNGDPWCASLDENEKLALEAIHALHHQLDDDKNGNIDLYESNEFLREELKYDRDYEKRQENFHRNNDNQVSVKELWETWVKSEVHNWTVDQTVDWIGTFVGLPQYQEKFTQLEINGTYLPRLAVNHHNFLTTNLGIKDVITRQKLTLKAQDVVLFGPPRDNTNHTKDAILTTLLVVAVTVCYLVYCRYKSSQRDLSRMSKDLEGLMRAEADLRDLQKELEKTKEDQEIREKEAVTHRNSSDDEDELCRLRDEVLSYMQKVASVRSLRGSDLVADSGVDEPIMPPSCCEDLEDEIIVLRNELQRAEVELQDKCWVPPPALTHWLQLTYELESKAHSKKRQSAEKQLKQAKEACDKLKKKRSSLMGAFVATHARSIDDVDKAILEARAALTEVTQELQERMHRWKQIEMLVKSPIVNNPGLASLEILLRNGSRSHPYLGTAGSVMSNSQDDIDDDGASSIYCPSAVHKLISTSAFMMYPGQTPRAYPPPPHASSSDYSSLTNHGSGDSGRPSQSPEMSRRDHHQQRASNISMCQNQSSHHQQNDSSSYHTASEYTESNEVSGPITNIHAPIARSKSVQSMLSLREQRGFNRESSSKDSSNGEEDMIMGDAAEMSAKDRRVTFRAAADRRSGQLRSFQGRTSGPLYEPMEFEETRNFYARKPLSPNSRLEKSSEEDSLHQQRKKQLQEEPDLIPCYQHVNSNVIEEEEPMSLGDDVSLKAQSDSNYLHHHSNSKLSTKPAIAEGNVQNESDDLFLDEPHKILLLNNNKACEPNKLVTLSLDESSSSPLPPPKLSFIKKISKLMRFGHDNHHGLNGKKTLRSSFTETNQNSHNHQQQAQNQQEKVLNGNNNSNNMIVNAAAPKNNLIISEKNILPGNNCSSNSSQSDNDTLSSTKSSKLKAQKKSLKFFTSLRRNKHTDSQNSSDFISS